MNNIFTKNTINDLVYFTDNRLTKYGVKHAFTTKLGGVSKGDFASLNLSFSRLDNKNDVIDNYKIISKALDINYNKITLTSQTHTKNIEVITENNIGAGMSKPFFNDVDGLITNLKNAPLFAFFADCVPIILYD